MGLSNSVVSTALADQSALGRALGDGAQYRDSEVLRLAALY